MRVRAVVVIVALGAFGAVGVAADGVGSGRLAGPDRWATAVAVSHAQFPNVDMTTYTVTATGGR